MISTKPFPQDPTTHPTVVAAREELRTKYRAFIASRKADFESRAEQAWQRHEESRRQTFLADFREGHWVRPENPFADLSDAAALRIVTLAEDRIKVLGETYAATKDVDFLIESLKIFLYRRKSKSDLSAVKEFLKEWIDVDGSEAIYTESHGQHYDIPGPVGRGQRVPHTDRHVVADGLSASLANILSAFKVKAGTVYFVTAVDFEDRPGLPVERWTLAHQMPDKYPASDF